MKLYALILFVLIAANMAQAEAKPPILGYMGPVTKVEGGINISGWSCQSQVEQPNTVNVYAENDRGVRTLIGTSIASTQREDAVRKACNTSDAQHGFNFVIPYENYSGLEGQKVRVWGLFVNNNAS